MRHDEAGTSCTVSTCTRTLRQHEHGRYICSPCEGVMASWLLELPTQMVVLRGSRLREITGPPVRSGTRTPPLPGRGDTLNLIGPAARGDVRDPHGDQTGPLPVAAVLTSWVQLIVEERRLLGPVGRPTEEQLAAWLHTHLEWAGAQAWVADMHDELGDMMRTIRDITRTRPRRRPVAQPCPRCDSLALIETDWQTYIECVECQRLFTRDDLALAARIAIAS